VLVFAPLYAGVLSRLKEMVQSRRGPSIFQSYRDIWKLFHEDEVISEETTWIFRFTPYLVFVMPIFVATLILAMENGAFLAGIAIASELPLIAELAVAIDIVLIAVVAGLLTRTIRETLGTTEAAALRALKEEPASWR